MTIDDPWVYILREGGGWAVAAFVLLRLDRKLAKMCKSLNALVRLVAAERGLSEEDIEKAGNGALSKKENAA